MKYLSGIHALNISCELNTCGDWHRSALNWTSLTQKMKDSRKSVFRDYGIEMNKTLNFLNNSPTMNVANHIRACLDLLTEGNFGLVQGMNRDFIANEKYDLEIFNKVMLLKNDPNWKNIDQFMGKEYKMKWLKYKEKHHDQFE